MSNLGNKLIKNSDFGCVLVGLKLKRRFSRKGWNGEGMYIELQVPDEHSKMKRPYIFISVVGGDLVPWVSSNGDLLANDWFEVEK